jgi:alpha-L-arabinofuranosidase
MKILYSILLLFAALAAGAQSSVPSQPVIATIDASRTGWPIAPYLFGQFSKHVGNIFYSSLWSKMLDDRKFYYAVVPQSDGDSGLGQGGRGGFSVDREG